MHIASDLPCCRIHQAEGKLNASKRGSQNFPVSFSSLPCSLSFLLLYFLRRTSSSYSLGGQEERSSYESARGGFRASSLPPRVLGLP